MDDALLPHRLPNALGDAAVGLAVQDHRIDRAADVIGGAIADDLDGPGAWVDLDVAGRAAIGIASVGEEDVALRGDRTAQNVVEVVELVRGPRNLDQADDAALSRSFGLERAVREFHVLRLDLQHVRRDLAAALDDAVRGIAHAHAGHAHGAARVRAAADRDDVGVALDQANLFERHAEPFAHALGEARLMPLPARERADGDLDDAIRQDLH